MTRHPAVTAHVQRDGKGWMASVQEVQGCHTHAPTLDVLRLRVVEAVQACIGVDGDVDVTMVVSP